jgi:hypothetical protein
MAGFFNQFLKQLGTGDSIKDYQHASRTFVDSLYRLSPKIGSMYHVFIELNPQIASSSQISQIETGLLAKSAQLPKFTIQNKVMNAYNRKNINQERVNYDPVQIVFHDDSADVVRNFWYQYYSYYFRDSDHNEALYGMEHKYHKRQAQDWGFSPKNQGAGTPNYIKSIRIYSLHQKYFSSYVLLRPTITSFAHGQHTAGEYTPMEHTMTVAYEAVQYEHGPVTSGTVKGFNIVHYDNSPSPLTSVGGGTRSILGPGGLVQGIGDAVTNLQDGNFGAAGIGALRTFNNFKNADFKQIASAELVQTATNILRGQNTQSTVFVPTASSVTEGLSKSVQSLPGLVNRNTATVNMNSQSNRIPSPNSGLADLLRIDL